jgi:hypothetical protein
VVYYSVGAVMKIKILFMEEAKREKIAVLKFVLSFLPFHPGDYQGSVFHSFSRYFFFKTINSASVIILLSNSSFKSFKSFIAFAFSISPWVMAAL